MQHLAINPHTATVSQLMQLATMQAIPIDQTTEENKAYWLDLLFIHCIEPHLGLELPLFIYDFPATHAALAQIRQEKNLNLASRFEIYFRGIELANGFHELQDAEEQRSRFEKDLKTRHGSIPIDERFLAALSAGLPNCAGVALGIDRLLMLALKQDKIQNVLSFDFERA